jgi:hypothetical protein
MLGWDGMYCKDLMSVVVRHAHRCPVWPELLVPFSGLAPWFMNGIRDNVIASGQHSSCRRGYANLYIGQTGSLLTMK